MTDAQPSDANAPPVLLAYFGRSQLTRSIKEAQDLFQTLIDLALMLEPDLASRSLHSLRGDSHRPGVRGLVIDRQSVMALSKSQPEINRELSADILTNGLFGQRLTHH